MPKKRAPKTGRDEFEPAKKQPTHTITRQADEKTSIIQYIGKEVLGPQSQLPGNRQSLPKSVRSDEGDSNSQKIEKEAGKPIRNRLTISARIVSL